MSETSWRSPSHVSWCLREYAMRTPSAASCTARIRETNPTQGRRGYVILLCHRMPSTSRLVVQHAHLPVAGAVQQRGTVSVHQLGLRVALRTERTIGLSHKQRRHTGSHTFCKSRNMHPPSTLSCTLRNTTNEQQAYTPATRRAKLTIFRFSHRVTLLSGLEK